MLLSLCWRCRRRVDRFAFRIASGASSLFGATPSCSAAPCPYPIALSYRYRFVRERPPVHALAVVQGLKAASKPYCYHAKAGKENIWTIPNLISFTRISLAPYLGYLVYTESFPLACGLFALAGLSDLFDGFIARRFKNQSSVLGSVLDPLADKCLISVLCVSLSAVGLIPGTCVNTALQLGLVALSMAAPLAGCVDHPFLHALWYTTGFTTVMSGLSYISKLGGFKILKQKKN